MSESRRITVEREDRSWHEDEREVRVEIWNDAYHTTALSLTKAEAMDLSVRLSNHLYWLARDEDEAGQ